MFYVKNYFLSINVCAEYFLNFSSAWLGYILVRRPKQKSNKFLVLLSFLYNTKTNSIKNYI